MLHYNPTALEASRREAEADIYGFKEERLKQSLLHEQERLREMLSSTNSYDPWGRPGGGAPSVTGDNKKKKFTEYDGFKQNNIGAGGLFDDLGLPPKLKSRLDNGSIQVSPEELKHSQERINNIRQELRMARAQKASNQSFEFYDPWGKGAGNPRRLNDGSVERHTGIKEKGIVPLLPNSQPDLSTEGLRDKNIGVGLELDSKYGGGGGGPAKTRSGNIKTRFPTTMKRDIYGNVSMKEETSYDPFKIQQASTDPSYFPFGKPGHGAPIKSDDGKLVPQRRGIYFERELDTSADVNKRKQAAENYLTDLKRGLEEQKMHRELDKQDQVAPFGELAAVVRQGKVGFPKRDPVTGQLSNQHRGTSDVTKHAIGQSPRGQYAGVTADGGNQCSPKEYYDQLTQLAEERHKQRQADREKELQQETQHTENWTDLWGRPGGGAPRSRDPVFRKTKLDKALHYPEDGHSPLPMHKLPKHVSSHENFFQMNEDRAMFRSKNPYGVFAPYATN